MLQHGRILRIVAAAGIIGATGACSGDADSTMDAEHTGAAATMAHGPGGHGTSGMQLDSLVMRRHAQEAAGVVSEMRQQVQRLRQLAAREWHAEVGTYVPRVARMLAMVDRHMREMDMGMGMDDEHMGAMMGMAAAEHRRMVDDMTALRLDAERLQIASAAEVMQSMPAHLDRLERLLGALERGATHMHAAGAMHGAGTTHGGGH